MEKNDETDNSNLTNFTSVLAQTLLLLSTKHFATDAILQESITRISSAYENCKQNFLHTLENSTFSDAERGKL